MSWNDFSSAAIAREKPWGNPVVATSCTVVTSASTTPQVPKASGPSIRPMPVWMAYATTTYTRLAAMRKTAPLKSKPRTS
jgi:hypothetical protein